MLSDSTHTYSKFVSRFIVCFLLEVTHLENSTCLGSQFSKYPIYLGYLFFHFLASVAFVTFIEHVYIEIRIMSLRCFMPNVIYTLVTYQRVHIACLIEIGILLKKQPSLFESITDDVSTHLFIAYHLKGKIIEARIILFEENFKLSFFIFQYSNAFNRLKGIKRKR